ncbi:MAG: beta-galactosidase [Thermodesulfobacteriota bacterium]
MKYIKELGVSQVRASGLAWGLIEPVKNKYDFTSLDKRLKMLQNTDTELIVATLRAISPWGGNETSQKGYKRSDPITAKSGFPSDIEAWKKFIRVIVERYDGDGKDDMPGLTTPVKYWQVEGEWMWQWKDTKENYVKFLKITYETIKEADPGASVIAGALTAVHMFALEEGLSDKDYFERGDRTDNPKRVKRQQLLHNKRYRLHKDKAEFFLSEAHEYFDIIDVHIYSRDAYAIPPVVQWVKSSMKKRGYTKPIWSLENSGPFYGYSEDKHAEEVVKRYMLSLSSGIDKMFWSSLWSTIGWGENYLRLSLVDRNGRKKPAFFTYKKLRSAIDGYDEFKRFELGGDVYAFRIKKDEKNIYVLWSEDGQEVELPVKAARIKSMDSVSLKEKLYTVGDGVVKIKLSGIPVIVEEL